MNQRIALIFVGSAGIFWALSGVAVQDFFMHSAKTPMDLTNIRMTVSGFLLLIIAWQHGGLKKSLCILKQRPRLCLDLIIYGIIGIALVQFSYFEGISIGGAAPTTVIQYSCPAIVVIWNSLYYRRLPKIGEIVAVILATTGVVMLVTGGSLDKLIVPLSCVFWSLVSGTSFAFASIFPKHLFAAQIDQYFLTSVGMIVGGLFTFLLIDNVSWTAFFEADVISDVAQIIILGTVFAFLLFNAGLIYLTPEAASITAATEPAASVVISYFMFGTAFGFIELTGIFLVIFAIICPVLIKK